MSFADLFSFKGRVERGYFWAVGLGGTVINLIAMHISTTLFVVVPRAILWVALANDVKRAHDRGKSGWFLLIALIPIVGGIWFSIELGFLLGTPGPNEYGKVPQPLAAV